MQEVSTLKNTCPHCGAALHERASFCPQCAKSVNERRSPKPPRLIPWKALRAGIALLVVLGIGFGVYVYTRPKVYDGKGEVIYTDADGSYQLVLAWGETPYEPIYEMRQSVAEDFECRYPVRLYVNHADSGADAGQFFLTKVERFTAEIVEPPDSDLHMTCTEPAPNSYAADATLVTFLDFIGREGTVQLLWTFYMKNGDVVRLRQDEVVTVIATYDYDPSVAPMDTLEELQALVEEIAETVEPEAVVNIYLPAVTYAGGLTMDQRPVNLYGSVEGDRRTTFTGPLRVAPKINQLLYVKHISFVGSGSGVGISTPVRLWVEDCHLTGWKTAVLSHGYGWVNTIGCLIEDNEVGLHFNSTGRSATHSMFDGNVYRNNGTAVLLENVPTDLTLNFAGTRFTDNGKDIDNPCGQPIDISQAIFE